MAAFVIKLTDEHVNNLLEEASQAALISSPQA